MGDQMLGVSDPQALVQNLRQEAEHLRDCFTQFSFKAIGFSSGALALMFAGYENLALVDFAAIPVVALLSIVARIGIYKYSASTRHFGYELHLARTEGVDYGEGGWRPSMRSVDWEEALRAWRVVQPALFRAIYRVPERYPSGKLGNLIRRFDILAWLNDKDPRNYRLNADARRVIADFHAGSNGPEYPWFMPQVLTHKNGESYYHAGSYLKNMFQIIFLMELLILLPMLLAIFDEAKRALLFPRLTVFVALVVMIAFRSARIARRRRILEHELLSIHSNAITWQAVILAHFTAKQSHRYGSRGYTEELAEQAVSLEKHAFRIHDWIAGRREFIRS